MGTGLGGGVKMRGKKKFMGGKVVEKPTTHGLMIEDSRKSGGLSGNND